MPIQRINPVLTAPVNKASVSSNSSDNKDGKFGLQDLKDLVEKSMKDGDATVPAAWDTKGSYPATDSSYSNAPRYIGLGQYGKGVADDFAANYGGVNDKQRKDIQSDPGNVSGHLSFTGPVDPNQVIKPVAGTNEIQDVNGSLAGSVGTYTYLAGSSTFSASAALGSYNDYASKLKGTPMGPATAKFFSNLLGNLGSSLYLAGSVANTFASSTVPVGAAVDNSESAKGFNNNVALFGANVEGGQRVMDAQTDAMKKATDALSKDDKGNFKDPEYAMRAINQTMKLSGQDPAFISKDNASLPEVTTANGQVDNVLPADIFSLGGASANSKDISSSLSNAPDVNAISYSSIDQRRKNDAQDVTDVSQKWLNDANKFASQADYKDATARQTGMTRMVNTFDGQLEKTSDSLNKYNDAAANMRKAVDGAVSGTRNDYEKLAVQAGDQITKNYAAEEGVDPKNVQPVHIGLNKPDTLDQRSQAATGFFDKLSDNATKNMNDSYSSAPNTNLWQIQQQLHTSLMASGSQLTPFTQMAQSVANDVFSNMDLIGKPGGSNYAAAKQNFVKDVRNNPGLFPTLNKNGQDQTANNIFKSGLSVNLSFDAVPINKENTRQTNVHGINLNYERREHIDGQSINLQLQVDNLHDDPGAIFDQIWNAVSDKVKTYPSHGSGEGWGFGNIALNGATPMTSDNKIGGDPNGNLPDHWEIGNAPKAVNPKGNDTGS